MDEVGQVRQRRQLRQLFQVEIIQELPGGRQQFRPPRCLPVSHRLYPFPLHQRADDFGAYADAADVLDLRPGDGLAVGDDGEGFQQRLRIAWRLFVKEPVDPLRHFRPRLEAEAAGDFFQLHAAVGVVRLQGVEGLPDVVSVRRHRVRLEQGRQIVHAQGVVRHHERGLHDVFQLGGFHAAALM